MEHFLFLTISSFSAIRAELYNLLLDQPLVPKGNKGYVTHTVTLPFTLKSTLTQKKNYGNSNISPCKKYNLQNIV
jgi:hypothetical protein